jgi:hypothetical protein
MFTVISIFSESSLSEIDFQFVCTFLDYFLFDNEQQ